MHNFGLSCWTTFPIIQKNHIVPGTRTVTNGNSDSGIAPFVNHKLTANLSTYRTRFVPVYTEYACNCLCTIVPDRRIYIINRNPAILLFDQLDVGSRQLIA